eukprot:scaffold11178_cov101-Isochrysis_galbana.AAC.1
MAMKVEPRKPVKMPVTSATNRSSPSCLENAAGSWLIAMESMTRPYRNGTVDSPAAAITSEMPANASRCASGRMRRRKWRVTDCTCERGAAGCESAGVRGEGWIRSSASVEPAPGCVCAPRGSAVACELLGNARECSAMWRGRGGCVACLTWKGWRGMP